MYTPIGGLLARRELRQTVSSDFICSPSGAVRSPSWIMLPEADPKLDHKAAFTKAAGNWGASKENPKNKK